MANVIFEDVWKRFDSTVAVQDFSLEIEDAEFMVLVCPSGCGKSTVLRMLAGLERVSEGRILIDERVVNNIAPACDLAMVFQSYALYPHMTVYDNLASVLRNQRLPKGGGRAGTTSGRHPAARRAPQEKAEAALGGAAPAGCARARDRA